jgi:DNA-binding NarL/FixJ family response regulator
MKKQERKLTKKEEFVPKRPDGAKKVFIVEDHPVFREGLAHLIDEEKDLRFCGAAGDAFAARREIARLKPDLVLVDISLPGKSGLELIKELRAADRKLKLLVVSMHDEALYANRVLRLGADGYIMKQEDPEEIVRAIYDVLGGHIYLSEDVLSPPAGDRAVSAPARPLDQLTDTELEILELMGSGNTNEEIASQFDCDVAQINADCEEIRKKLNLKNEMALIRYAVCWVETGKT